MKLEKSKIKVSSQCGSARKDPAVLCEMNL